MKSVSEMRDLEQFGIKPLTGEADALGFRILCDLDEQGVRVFKECFGMDVPPKACRDSFHDYEHFLKLGLNVNWNSGSIASVMLTGHDVVPLAIMGFYLQGKNVIVTDHTVYALEAKEDIVLDESGDFYNFIDYLHNKQEPRRWSNRLYGEVRRIIKQKTSDGQIVQGTRNVHQMTGRVS